MVEEIIKMFNIEGKMISCQENNTGNINSTYVVTMEKEDKSLAKYLVQKINTNVFPEPYKLMKNIENITNYLETEIKKDNDTKHQVLKVIHTHNGKSLGYISSFGERDYYRVYKYIENAVSFDTSVDKDIVYNTGKAFGNFQKLLKDYPLNRLTETIKDFHNTVVRYEKLMEDIKIDSENRVMEVAEEIVFILKHEDLVSLIMERLGTSGVPYRVTHNDTKVNNVLMDKETNDFLAVIDLDTVMPGSMLFDYGDGIRSTASNAKEDETDLSKVSLNLDLFEAYTDGYLSEMAEYLTFEEVSLMADAIIIITLELAIRFLNDYINGDTYFKINYEKHNLDRTRCQIALVKDMEKKRDYLKEYIESCYFKYMKNIKGIARKKSKLN